MCLIQNGSNTLQRDNSDKYKIETDRRSPVDGNVKYELDGGAVEWHHYHIPHLLSIKCQILNKK